MDGQLEALDPAAHIHRIRRTQELRDTRVLPIGGPQYTIGFPLVIRLPDVFDVEDREHDSLGIAER